jgi:hypothetical protein
MSVVPRLERFSLSMTKAPEEGPIPSCRWFLLSIFGDATNDMRAGKLIGLKNKPREKTTETGRGEGWRRIG